MGCPELDMTSYFRLVKPTKTASRRFRRPLPTQKTACTRQPPDVGFGLRFYNPLIGRWINRDPIEEKGGMNVYAMNNNDMVNGWDYLGLEKVGTSITRIFLSRLLTAGVVDWFRANHYDLFDENGEMDAGLSTYTKEFYTKYACSKKGELKNKNEWKSFAIPNQKAGDFYITGGLLGFWLNGTSNVEVTGAIDLVCLGGILH